MWAKTGWLAPRPTEGGAAEMSATSLLLRKTFLEKHNLGLLAHACTLTAKIGACA